MQYVQSATGHFRSAVSIAHTQTRDLTLADSICLTVGLFFAQVDQYSDVSEIHWGRGLCSCLVACQGHYTRLRRVHWRACPKSLRPTTSYVDSVETCARRVLGVCMRGGHRQNGAQQSSNQNTRPLELHGDTVLVQKRSTHWLAQQSPGYNRLPGGCTVLPL